MKSHESNNNAVAILATPRVVCPVLDELNSLTFTRAMPNCPVRHQQPMLILQGWSAASRVARLEAALCDLQMTSPGFVTSFQSFVACDQSGSSSQVASVWSSLMASKCSLLAAHQPIEHMQGLQRANQKRISETAQGSMTTEVGMEYTVEWLVSLALEQQRMTGSSAARNSLVVQSAYVNTLANSGSLSQARVSGQGWHFAARALEAFQRNSSGNTIPKVPSHAFLSCISL